MTTPPPPPPPPPGWYPDPSGGSRYWDGSQWGPLTAPGNNPPLTPPDTAARPPVVTPGQTFAGPTAVKKKSPLKALIIAGAVLLLGGACVAALGNSDKPSSSKSSTSAATATEDTAERAAEEAKKQAQLNPATYKDITARDFALIAKDPDAHIGEKIVVYGVVTQFDAATGKKGFRADTDAVPHQSAYDFDQNTAVYANDPSILTDVVQKDFVTMWVEVAGSFSYDTQIGGSTTVPKFDVYIIKVTGSSG